VGLNHAGFDSDFEYCPVARRASCVSVFVTLLWIFAALVGVAVALGACWRTR
jgi:hypothetical protein